MEFGLEKLEGYFVLDNAGNSNIGVEALGQMLGFNPSKHRLRCTAHIANLVAMKIMYGKDLRAFETEGDGYSSRPPGQPRVLAAQGYPRQAPHHYADY
ncbi:hypothetical protein FOXG_19652 [Fusarium oxysporum f. sp. lycopersici 4287]|uniref:Uncharacterized protein n=1 Tax=Fusarium oxysporum f. sp. lycopersici (strain 4287 / CBS 123668 / FGSC 9935 / NRRL 34936) TaxID=426428 RepID=A0A0J9WMZ2_FUSO4|nr:hypothetical protein FOXG_19652 [Fusarium oxysporum f. sp. lycopersici 4287]KNB06377.1 hypothetical protein FOXG_19652 [Fusarium oxysporum f. sp. lycopersici 4287]